MNKFKTVVISLSAAALIGCGDEGADDEVVVSEEAIQADVSKNLDMSQIPDAETALKEAAGITEEEAAPGGAPGAAPTAGMNGVLVEETEGEGGISTTTPLALMQQAVEFYHSPTERGLDDYIEDQLGKMNFETEQGYDRARAQLEEKMKIPPLQSLDGLVKARIIARIPPAPEGKKWSYNPGTKKVSLEDL